jgi:hypothetical protein
MSWMAMPSLRIFKNSLGPWEEEKEENKGDKIHL